MSNSFATSTARLDGAPTAATIGIPPISAFCRSSKLARPESKSTRSRKRRAVRKEFRANQLIHRVVTAYIFAKRQ